MIGVGITGIAADKINPNILSLATQDVIEKNRRIAYQIGINPAVRTTTVKPSGTSSLVLGTSSGIHAYHNDFYVRRMRFGNDEAILQYLKSVVPELIEPCKEKPHLQSVLSIPQRSPQGAVVRTEHPLELLERVRLYNQLWVKEGHVYGDNNNNVSCTISLKDHEWAEVGEWMWGNRNTYNGISVLPYDGGTYVQAPFEDIFPEEYENMVKLVRDIDLRNVLELTNNVNLAGELACAADGCVVV